MFKKTGISTKLILGFLLGAIITLSVGALGWWGISSINTELTGLADESLPTIINLQRASMAQQKIKAAIRTMMDPTLTHERKLRQFEIFEESRKEYAEAKEIFDPIERIPEEDVLYKDFLAKMELAHEANDKMVEEMKKMLKPNADNMAILEAVHKIEIEGEQRAKFDAMLAAANKLTEFDIEYYGHEIVEEAKARANTLNIIIIVVALAAFFIALVLGIVIANSISKPISQMTTDLFSSSGNMESASGQVASASQELSSGAAELSSSVEEMSASLEELQSIIETTTRNTNDGQGMITEANKGSQQSIEQMVSLEESMTTIAEKSKRVSKVIKTIDDIAFQTNILALNAAVEAARAGDAGRGFAVVAEQVKSLAAKSAEAAKETAVLIEDALQSVEDGKSQSDIVKKFTVAAGELMEKTNVIMEEITRASNEQLKGANQITQAITQINSVTQQTAATSEENAAAGEEMMTQAELLGEIVKKLNSLVEGNKKKMATAEKHIAKIEHAEHQTKIVHSGIQLHQDDGVEIIKPEDKLSSSNFANF